MVPFLPVILLICVSLDAHFALTQVDFILAGENHQALVEYFRLSTPNSIYYILPFRQLASVTTPCQMMHVQTLFPITLSLG